MQLRIIVLPYWKFVYDLVREYNFLSVPILGSEVAIEKVFRAVI
jgi:hypothetical protein